MSTRQSGWGFDYGALVANADMATHQFKFVTTGSVAGEFKVANGASGPMPIGVLQNDPRVGEPGSIRITGTAKVAASGAIGYGDFITCGSNAFAIVKSTCGTVLGIALGALASGSGYIEALLLVGGLGMADNTP